MLSCLTFASRLCHRLRLSAAETATSPANVASPGLKCRLAFLCRNTNIFDICFPIFTQLHDTKSPRRAALFFLFTVTTRSCLEKRRNRLDRVCDRKNRLWREVLKQLPRRNRKCHEGLAASWSEFDLLSGCHSTDSVCDIIFQRSPNTLSTASLMVFVGNIEILGGWMTMAMPLFVEHDNDEN